MIDLVGVDRTGRTLEVELEGVGFIKGVRLRVKVCALCYVSDFDNVIMYVAAA